MTQLFRITNSTGHTLFIASVTRVATIARTMEPGVLPDIPSPEFQDNQEPEEVLEEFCKKNLLTLEPLQNLVV